MLRNALRNIAFELIRILLGLQLINFGIYFAIILNRDLFPRQSFDHLYPFSLGNPDQSFLKVFTRRGQVLLGVSLGFF